MLRGVTRTALPQVYDSARRPPPAFEELVALWAYRDLVVQLVRRDLVARYKRSVLGVLWTLLNPLGTMMILVVVFSRAFAADRTYPAYVLAGLLGWNFFRIVEFAELTPFIDAPVRTYSSGMVARPGFAIATEQRPDVLLMDEVLAVGDQAFQAKCKERFEAFRAFGTAIVLVSHDQRLVAATCQRAVWLERGEVRQSGPVTEVVAAYAGPS